MKIEVGKTYINGNKSKVEIIKKINYFEQTAWIGVVASSCKQMGEYPAVYTSNGYRIFEREPRENLPSNDPIKQKHYLVSEYHPAHDWEVDKPIWVQDRCEDEWRPCHFSRIAKGKIWAWTGGQTSHTMNSETVWKYATDKNPYEEQEDESRT